MLPYCTFNELLLNPSRLSLIEANNIYNRRRHTVPPPIITRRSYRLLLTCTGGKDSFDHAYLLYLRLEDINSYAVTKG